jgi:adenylate cyclase class IV
MRALRGSTVVEPEFDVLLLEAIDDALSALGDSIMQTVCFHVERSFHIKKQEIPYRLGAFTEAIENIFGVGADFIEILIMKKLHQKVDARFMWNEAQEFGLVQYVSEAKRVFQKKNVIKTVEELVECEEIRTEL